MSNDSGFNMADVKANLASTHHSFHVAPTQIDISTPAPQPAQTTNQAFYLATDSIVPGDRFSSEAAKNRLAQEALLANPAEIRKMFPQLLKDVSVHGNDHLDQSEIRAGLQNTKLPQSEINVLTVLYNGYPYFRQMPNGRSVAQHDQVALGSENVFDGRSAPSRNHSASLT